MELNEKSQNYLDTLLSSCQESFEGLSSRWNELQPKGESSVKASEDFHLGFVFGKLEDAFVAWFYSNHGRGFDANLGRVKYSSSRREKVVMMSFPIGRYIILIIAEPSVNIDRLGWKIIQKLGKQWSEFQGF